MGQKSNQANRKRMNEYRDHERRNENLRYAAKGYREGINIVLASLASAGTITEFDATTIYAKLAFKEITDITKEVN